MNTKDKRIYLILLIIVASIPYIRVLFFDFVWDDIPQIIYNNTVKNFNILDIFTKEGEFGVTIRESKTPYYRPIFLLSLALDYFIFGENPAFFHLTNIIFHTLLTIIIFYVLSLYYEDKFYAFLGAFFVGIYPVRAEAVAYISARLHILGSLFTILAFYHFKRFLREDNKKFYVFSLLSYFLAVFCIEMSIFLPVFLIFEEGLDRVKRTVRLILPHLAIILIYLLARYLVLNKFIWLEVLFTTRLYTGLTTYIRYLQIIFFPFNLKVFYENFTYFKKIVDVSVVSGFVAFILSIYGLCLSYKKNRTVFLGLLWFFLTFFFISNIPYLMYPSLIAERYLYFPLIGLGFVIPEFFQILLKGVKEKKRVIIIFCLLFFIPSFYSIYERVFAYRDNQVFWERATKDAPQNIYALDQLAQVYLGMGNYFEALKLYESIEKINPNDFDNYTKIGDFYLRFGDHNSAEIYYNRALSIKEYDEALWGLARVYIIRNDLERAKNYLQRAIKLSPHKKKYKEALKGL